MHIRITVILFGLLYAVVCSAQGRLFHVPGEAIVKFAPAECESLRGRLNLSGSDVPSSLVALFPGLKRMYRLLRDEFVSEELAAILAQCVYRVVYDNRPSADALYLEREAKYFETIRQRFASLGGLVERNGVGKTTQGTPASPDDPFLPQQWHIYAIGAHHLWGKGIVGSRSDGLTYVAMDTGGEEDHPDLVANIDQLRSRSFVAEEPTPFPDRANHGVRGIGTACAVGNNAIGISGVAQRCNVLVLKVGGVAYGRSYISHDAVLSAYYHLLNNVPGVLVVNNSFVVAYSKLLEEVIDAGRNRMIVFAAAGNDAGPGNPGYVVQYPGGLAERLSNVICVAATTETNEFVWYSNREPLVTTIAAPGIFIFATAGPDGYGMWGGASAAAYVASGTGYLWISALMERRVSINADIITRVKQFMREGGRIYSALGRIPALDAWYGWVLLEQSVSAPPLPAWPPRRRQP